MWQRILARQAACWSLALLAPFSGPTFAAVTPQQLEPCAVPDADIPNGNRTASALFDQRVRDRAAISAAASQAPLGFAKPETFGAKGDGRTDDTAALQAALAKVRRVWLGDGRIYRFSRRLVLGDGTEIRSNGTATLLMSAGEGGFDNSVPKKSDSALYGEHGEGLRVQGHDIAVSDVFIVKEYADDRYVIGIDIRQSSKVSLQRIRLRGFSLAPGIITIRSSDDVEVSNSLISASCTQSRAVPEDVPIFQITGISVDDARLKGRGSNRLRLTNNVIADVHMVPLTPRGEQSDGINFAAIGTGDGSEILNNDIRNVDEGLDLWGAGISVRGNHVEAHSLPLKFIHGAHSISVVQNEFVPGPNGKAFAMYRANPPEAQRQVHDIVLRQNKLDLSQGQRVGALVESAGDLSPSAISLNENEYVVATCEQRSLKCGSAQCAITGDRTALRNGSACPK